MDLFHKAKDGATGIASEGYGIASGVLDQFGRGWDKTKEDVEKIASIDKKLRFNGLGRW